MLAALDLDRGGAALIADRGERGGSAVEKGMKSVADELQTKLVVPALHDLDSLDRWKDLATRRKSKMALAATTILEKGAPDLVTKEKEKEKRARVVQGQKEEDIPRKRISLGPSLQSHPIFSGDVMNAGECLDLDGSSPLIGLYMKMHSSRQQAGQTSQTGADGQSGESVKEYVPRRVHYSTVAEYASPDKQSHTQTVRQFRAEHRSLKDRYEK